MKTSNLLSGLAEKFLLALALSTIAPLPDGQTLGCALTRRVNAFC